jgi:hypothetical protein
MDKSTQEYFETYFDLFSHQGWKTFVAEIVENRERVNSVETTTDANDLFFRKGQLNVLNTIINFEQALELAFQSNDETSNDVEG